MEYEQAQKRRQSMDDTFDAFSMLAGGNYVTLYDVKAQMTRWTPAAVELFDLPGEYIPYGAYDWGDYVHPDDRKRYEDEMNTLIASGKLSYDITYRVRTRDGRYGVFRNVGAVLRDDDGNPDMIGGMIVNEGLIENTDPVTVLRNQYGFFTDLAEAMKTERTYLIMLVGLGNLSRINAAYGYGYGNRVLQQVAMLFQEAAGRDGGVYRLDGSKFGFMTDSLTGAETEKLYETVRRRLKREVRVDGIRNALTCSGAMVSVRGSEMDPRTVYSCLAYAYRESRDRRHGALVPFNTGISMERITAVRTDIVNGCKGFFLHYQPVLDIATMRPIGAEALVRWSSEPWGELPPGQFLPPLEEDSLFEELGNWIMVRAMEEGKRFLARDPNFIIAVNVTPGQLEKDYFIDTLLEALRETAFPAERLCLELTEECRQLDIGLLRDTARALKQHKVRFTLDDFGSGADSLGCLKALAPDYVKFDQRLVLGIGENEAGRKALANLAGLAAAYGASVCVKCVETSQLDRLLKEYPIRELQGRLYMPPVPPEEILSTYFPD